MGGNNSRGESKVRHFYFGEVIKREITGKQVLIVKKPIMNQTQYKSWKVIFDDVIELHHESLFLPQNSQLRNLRTSILDCNCCAASHEVQLTYQDFESLLYAQISHRVKDKKYFQQAEIILMMYKLLEGSKQFAKKGKSLGDIRPKNIIVNRSGDLKMINLASFPWQKTAIDKYLDDNDITSIFYFAPEQINFLNSSSRGRGNFPNSKTQAFSIAMTLIEIATLNSSETLYIQKRKSIDENLLHQRMRQIKQRYPILSRYLDMIVRINPNDRLSSGQAWACLKIYSQKITQVLPFSVNERLQAEQLAKFKRNK